MAPALFALSAGFFARGARGGLMVQNNHPGAPTPTPTPTTTTTHGPQLRVAITLEQCWHAVPGGTATAAVELCRELARRPDVDAIGVSAWHRRPAQAGWVPPIPVRQLRLPRLALYEAWHWLRRPAVQRATGPVAVVHATGMAMPPRRAPIVLTVHDLAYLHDRGNFSRRGVSFFLAALDRAMAEADLVLCSSDATRRDALAAGFDSARLRVVPLGVRAERTAPEMVAALRRRLGLARDYVAFVGTPEPRKNLAALIEAFGRLDRTDLDLVVAGPDGWGIDLDALSRPLGDRIRRVGMLPAVDRDALMAGAEALCYPSLFEGFGLPVLEAMAQGTPVVTSAGIATEEAAGAAAVLVDPHCVASIADGLASVVDDPAKAAWLREAGLARAAAMSWQRTADLTVAAYRELVP